MKRSITILAVGILGMLTALPVAADGKRGRGWDHEDRIAQRIEQGIATGELSRHERKVLRRERREIARLERRFLRDDHLNRRERRVLREMRADLSDHIYTLKHNHHYRERPRRHRDRHAHDRDDGWWISLGIVDH